LDRLELLLCENVDLRNDERPRINTADLVTRRDLTVHHHVAAKVVVERYAVIGSVAFEALTHVEKTSKRAVRRISQQTRRVGNAGRRKRAVRIPAPESVGLVVLGCAQAERERQV